MDKEIYKNKMHIEFDAKSENESFARIVVASFAAQLDPTLDELADIKTAVSEAVTNAIIHGYEGIEDGMVYIDATIEATIEEDSIEVVVLDKGVGIENVLEACEPLFTTRPESERSGMGFTFMQIFMDDLQVESELSVGTKVTMRKIIRRSKSATNKENDIDKEHDIDKEGGMDK